MRLLLWFISVSVLILVSWLLWGGSLEKSFSLEGSVAWLEKAGPWGWAAGIGLLAADLVLPVPGTVVMSALGYVYGAAIGGLIASVGSITAGVCGYGVGRLIGEKAARRWLGEIDFERGKLLFARGGGWMVAVSRSLPILPEAISCTAGLVRMPFGRFMVSLVCGSLPVGYLFAWIGVAGRETPGWALVFSLLAPAVLWLVAKKWLQ